MALDEARQERIRGLLKNINYEEFNNFKIVALYKTFSGEEFVEASLESIYHFMHKIVMVHSDVSWSGEYGNTVLPLVNKWKNEHDIDNKLVNINVSMRSQDEQYKCGYDYIKSHFPEAKMVMLIDTDEVWDEDVLHEFILRAFKDTQYNTFSCRLHTYIKSIHYKVEPMEWCKPTIFIRTTEPKINGPRGINNSNKVLYNDIQAHHFTYVRKDEETVMKKIKTSFIGDGPGTQCVPMQDWLDNKWNKLPFAKDFHTTKTAETSWHSIKPVLTKDLPSAVRSNTEVLNRVLPFGHLLETDCELLFKYSENADLAVDLGTYKGRSAIILSLHAKRVVTIDLFEDIAKHTQVDDKLRSAYEFYGSDRIEYDNCLADVEKTLSLYSNVEIIKGITYEQASLFKDESVDTIFIDGDHSYEGVKADFESWFPKVKRGGYILFHDYSTIHTDILDFVDNEVDTIPTVRHVETEVPMIVFQKL
jgi:hypothetical protein